MHSLENLRGVPNKINRKLHLSTLRREWDAFYEPFWASATLPTKEQLLEKATELDKKFGWQFRPKR